MNKYWSWIGIVAVLLLGLMTCCKPREHAQPKPHWFKHYTQFHEKEYIQFIESQIDNDRDSTLRAAMVRDFYRSRHFQPFWTQKGLQEAFTDSLLTTLANAYPQHGIPAEYFQLDSIRHAISQLVEHEIPNNEELYPHLYRLERQLTDQYLRYACALRYGAVNPKAVHGSKWYYETLSPDSAFLLTALDNMHRFADYLPELYPQSADYKILQKEWRKLLAEPDSVAIMDTTLLPLQFRRDAMVANLERLRWQTRHRKEDDTIYIAVNIPDYTLCVVQKDTVVMRNRICCGRTQSPEKVPARHKNGLITPYKAETPLMYSQIRTLVLNPEWNIPYDIIKDEYYPKLVRSNTAVVKREHLYIRDSRNGKYVIPDSIDWNRVNRGNIPYRLHQTSGRYNALGLYKFVFANSESVYLHDTNNKGAFKRNKRALSHGCVRVQHPDSVAEWVYAVNRFDTNYIEQLHIISGAEPTTEKGEEFLEKKHEKDSLYYENLSDWDKLFYRELRPSSVTLRKPIPLFIEYYTCFVGDDGTVQYREDVYYKDGNILYLMKNPN
ncbi:MAG: L,D-transpeptidase family protein [Bacteroidales bacterium]|nr:L,D-transpeptidase family protein [Bacteroidales bacterium]